MNQIISERKISALDNLSIDQLLERERETRAAHDGVVEVIKARLLADCPVKVGCTYLITGKKMTRRRMLVVVRHVKTNWYEAGEFRVRVEGPLANAKSLCGDGFNIRPQVVLADNIDLKSEQPCPDAARERLK